MAFIVDEAPWQMLETGYSFNLWAGYNGAHRIELEVYAYNKRAAHVYESIGFVREGVRR